VAKNKIALKSNAKDLIEEVYPVLSTKPGHPISLL
jgi:hypothetical protein